MKLFKLLPLAGFIGLITLLATQKAEATQWGVWTLVGYANSVEECQQMVASSGYRKYLFGGPACWGTNLGR